MSRNETEANNLQLLKLCTNKHICRYNTLDKNNESYTILVKRKMNSRIQWQQQTTEREKN